MSGPRTLNAGFDLPDSTKLAHAANVLEQQNELLRELHSAFNAKTKLAAALCQAVKLAEDGLLDVSDIIETARRLVADGSVKMSAADELFNESPGAVVEGAANRSQLDPLTSYLRGAWSGPTTT